MSWALPLQTVGQVFGYVRRWRDRVLGPTATASQLPVPTGAPTFRTPKSCVLLPVLLGFLKLWTQLYIRLGLQARTPLFFGSASLICSSTPTSRCMLLLLLSRFSRVRLCVTPWTAAHQAPPPMGFSRQEYWSGLPLPSPIDV